MDITKVFQNPEFGSIRLTEYSMKTNFGSDRLVKVSKVTTKGQSYFINKFRKGVNLSA